MAKDNKKRGNREMKKPKKAKEVAPAPVLLSKGLPSLGKSKKKV